MNVLSDIEMSFVRTLSVHGLILSSELSKENRRERIRVAIIQQRLELEKYDVEMTFAQAYQRCYARPLEMRRVPRDENQRPIDYPVAAAGDFGDEDDEDGAF